MMLILDDISVTVVVVTYEAIDLLVSSKGDVDITRGYVV